MILLLGGTSESIEIAQALDERAIPYILSVVTEYGEEIAKQVKGKVRQGRLDEAGMIDFCHKHQVHLMIDGTHPFARVVSKIAIEVTRKLGISYIRYEREDSDKDENVILVKDIQEACQKALSYEGNIYLSTGSKELHIYLQYLPLERVVVRVLPTVEVCQLVTSLGLSPKQIHGIQGPFQEETDIGLMLHAKAKVLITKDSGARGGVNSKLGAARALGIPCIMIERESIDYPCVVTEVKELIDWVESNEDESNYGC